MLKQLLNISLQIILYPVKLASKGIAKLLEILSKGFDKVAEGLQQAQDKLDDFANN